MKKILGISVCAVCLSLIGFVARSHGAADSKADFEKWVEKANKAQTENDAKWMEANLANAYVEGTSFGTWIPKAQLIKEANDPANNKFTKNELAIRRPRSWEMSDWRVLRKVTTPSSRASIALEPLFAV